MFHYFFQFPEYTDRFASLSDRFISAKPNIISVFNEKQLVLNLKSLSTFRNAVVYIDLLKDEHYEQLIWLQSKTIKVDRYGRENHNDSLLLVSVEYVDHLATLFESWGIDLTPEKKFTPHITLMKLSRSAHFHKKGRQIVKAWLLYEYKFLERNILLIAVKRHQENQP